MVRFTPERQRSVRFLPSFCVSCAPPSLPEVGGVFFIGPAVPFRQSRFAYGEAAWPGRGLSVPFSKQKSRTTGTNVLGTARFLEPSDRRNSLRQNPGHVKSRRISHSDSASSDRAFSSFSEKRRCKKTYFFRNPLAKSEEICYTTFGRRLSGCIGVPRTLMQVCHIAVWQTAFFLRSHYSLKKHFCQPVFENYFGFLKKFFQRVFQEKPFMKNICLYKALFRRFSRKVFRKSLAKSRKLCYSISGRRSSGCMGVPRTPVQVCHIPV